jgi:YVTN family beta-propeller protein
MISAWGYPLFSKSSAQPMSPRGGSGRGFHGTRIVGIVVLTVIALSSPIYSLSGGSTTPPLQSPQGQQVPVALSFCCNTPWVSSLTATTVSVVFEQHTLPLGSSWSITLNGSSESTTSSAISFNEYPGRFNLTIGSPSGFGSSKISGPNYPSQFSVRITGNSIFTVTFAPLVTVTFVPRNGAEVCSEWGVSIHSSVTHGGPSPQSGSTLYGGCEPYAISYDSNGHQLFVGNVEGGNVSILNATTGQAIGSIKVGLGPDALALDSTTNQLFVANLYSDNVSVVSLNTDKVVGSIELGANPVAVSLDERVGALVVSTVQWGPPTTSPKLLFANLTTDTVTSTLDLPSAAGSLSLDSADGLLFASGPNSTTVLRDTTLATIGNISIPDTLGSVYVPATDETFITNTTPSGEDFLQVINDSTLLIQDTMVLDNVGYGGAFWLTYDSGLREVFVSSANLTVVSALTDQIVANVSTGDSGQSTYAPDLGEIFMANDYPSVLDAVSDGSNTVVQNVSFVGGGTTAGESLSFRVTMGRWDYRFSTNSPQYRPKLGIGSVLLRSDAVVRLNYKPITQTLVLIASGLPSGTEWGFNESGVESGVVQLHTYGSYDVGTSSVRLQLVNGTYTLVFWADSSLGPSPSTLMFSVVAPQSSVVIRIHFS